MKQQAERGVLWRLVDAFGGQAISFIAFLILARLLRPDDYGAIEYFCSLGFELSALVPNTVGQFPQLIEIDAILIRSDLIG